MGIVSQTKLRILRELRRDPCHGYALAKRLKLPVSYIYEHLRELRQAELVEASGRGRVRVYRVTSRGEHLLKAFD